MSHIEGIHLHSLSYDINITIVRMIFVGASITVDVVTRPWARQSGVQFLAQAREFSPLQNVQSGSEPNQPPISRYQGVFSTGVK